MHYMKTTCKVCNTELEVEKRCKACNEPTRMFCHACGIVREKQSHPECLRKDLASLLLEVQTH